MNGWKTIPLTVVLATAAGCSGGPAAVDPGDHYEGWACVPNRIAQTTFTLDPSAGGEETKEGALLAAAELLAKDGVANREALAEAAAAPTAGSGLLVVQGETVADVTLTQFDDGTWSIASMLYCSAPPTGGGAGLTPS